MNFPLQRHLYYVEEVDHDITVTPGVSPLTFTLELQVRHALQGCVLPKIIKSRDKEENLGTVAHESR